MAVKWFGDSIAERVRKGVMRGVISGTQIVQEEMIRSIMEPPKSGKIYTRRGVKHQASAPGEKPANDTGNLAKSITTSFDPANLTGTINVGAEYGARLEYGFVGQDSAGRTIDQAPRPFARPALADKEKEIRDEIMKGVAGGLR